MSEFLPHGVPIPKNVRWIASVFYFPNGRVAVFDQRGQQMHEFQGGHAEMKSAIDAALEKQEFKPEIKGIPQC